MNKPEYIKDNHQLSFLSIVGSQAYGLNIDSSDTDLKGFCIPNKRSLYGIAPFEQFEHRDCLKDSSFHQLWQDDPTGDTTVYSISKFVKLALDNNPSIIELLAVDEQFIIHKTPEYQFLAENLDSILCKNAKYRFAGYAHAQFQRITKHRQWLLNPPKKRPERSDFGLPDVQDLSQFKMVRSQIDKIINFNDLDALELDNEQKYFIREALSKRVGWDAFDKDYNKNMVLGVMKEYEIDQKYMNYFTQESAFQNALRAYNDYEQWKKTRNEKRQALEAKCGYDSKHASHCLRLLRMGIEIMQGKGIKVYRHDDRDELIDLKIGNWNYDTFLEKFENETAKLDTLYETSTLRHKPNRAKFDDWLVEVYDQHVTNK